MNTLHLYSPRSVFSCLLACLLLKPFLLDFFFYVCRYEGRCFQTQKLFFSSLMVDCSCSGYLSIGKSLHYCTPLSVRFGRFTSLCFQFDVRFSLAKTKSQFGHFPHPPSDLTLFLVTEFSFIVRVRKKSPFTGCAM